MRALLIGDVIAAARALLPIDESRWEEEVERMFAQAQIADLHRLASGRSHPDWGNGSLMSVAVGCNQSREPFLSDGKYLRALKCVIEKAIRSQEAFVSGDNNLYSSQYGSSGGEGNGRVTCEDGIH